MYANLRVEIEGEPEPVFAWAVKINRDRSIVLSIDGNDGNGNYAEPAGERTLTTPGEITIQADY